MSSNLIQKVSIIISWFQNDKVDKVFATI